MTSTIRPATEEERGLAMTFAQEFQNESIRDLVKIGEDRYGLRVIFKKNNAREIPILMPSGRVLVRDLMEHGWDREKALYEFGRLHPQEDMTPNGEIASALDYAGLVHKAYLNLQVQMSCK